MSDDQNELKRQGTGLTEEDYSDDSCSESEDSFDPYYEKMLEEKLVKKKSVMKKVIKARILTDEQLAEDLDHEIKLFQGAMQNCGFYFDYFKIWKFFESKSYVKEEVNNKMLEIHEIANFMNTSAKGVNECAQGQLGEKPEDNMIMCEICYDDFAVWDAKHLGCNHYFCNEDFIDTIKCKITERKKWDAFRCPTGTCGKLMNFDYFKTLKMDNESQKLMYFYQKRISEDIVSANPSVFPCKVKGCDKFFYLPYSLISRAGLARQSEILKTEQAYKEKYPMESHFCACCNITCIGCEEGGHEPIRCGDAFLWRKNVDKKKDELSDLWIMKNTKKCPHCKTPTAKNGGCDHMSCMTCYKDWCWVCETPDWKNYGHRCAQSDLSKPKPQKETMEKERLELCEKYINLYAESDYNLKINVTTLFSSQFDTF